MSYYITKQTPLDFESAIQKVTAELGKEGFGILTRIDVQETLKNKLDVEFRPYVILGACNPPFALRALQAEDKIGLMLPCNVIVQKLDSGVEVSAIDPPASMKSVENPQLADLAGEVQSKLRRAIDAV